MVPVVISKPAPRTILCCAVAMIATQIVIRAWLVARGNFYWDDLILIGRASTASIWSWDYLMQDQDGHLMPLGFLVAGITTEVAPLNWAVPAVTLVVGQLLVSLAVLRMLVVLAGRMRPALLLPFGFFLFTPMTVPAYVWWASGLNTLPFQLAMALVVADAVQLCRGQVVHPRRVVARSLVIFVVGLAFFEKSVLILPVAAAAAVLWCLVAGPGSPDERRPPVRAAWAAARGLWFGMAGITAVWAVGYFTLTSVTDGHHSIGQTVELVWRSISRGLVPAIVGGPWDWERWNPSPPMAAAPWWLIAAGWIAAVAAVGYAIGTRRGASWIVVAAAGYVSVLQLPLLWSRTSEFTAVELTQTLRYLPDSALVIAIAMALIIVAPWRAGGTGDRASAVERRWALPVVAVVSMAFIASSLVSTIRFADEWRNNPTAGYLANARTSLAEIRDTPMLDHPVPLEVLLPVTYPDNQVSRVFAGLDQRPQFGRWTDRLQLLDDNGRLVPGDVTAARTFPEGAGTCDRPEVTGPTTIVLNGPLVDWGWTIALPYCANIDGTLQVALSDEDADGVDVPVKAGLHTVYVQVEGAGTEVRLRPLTPGLNLHVGQGRVGELTRAF